MSSNKESRRVHAPIRVASQLYPWPLKEGPKLCSATKVLLYRFPPHCSPFVKMHGRNIAVLQPIDRLGEFFAQAFVLDVLDGIQIRLEGEDESFRFGQAVEGLTFAADEGLQGLARNSINVRGVQPYRCQWSRAPPAPLLRMRGWCPCLRRIAPGLLLRSS